MKTSLTQEQLDALPKYRDRWLKNGLQQGKPLPDDATLLELFAAIYKEGGEKPPTEIRRVVNPWEGAVEAARLVNKTRRPTNEQIAEQARMCGWGSMDASWLSYYSYYLEMVPEVTGVERLVPHMKVAELPIGWWWPIEHIVVVCPVPQEIHLSNGRLHRSGGPAIKYEGQEVYALNGVIFEGDMIRFVTDDPTTIRPEDVLKIENTEMRYAVIRRIGLANMLEAMDAEKLDSDGDYSLYLVEIEGRKTGPYLKMACPSTGRVYLEGVGDVEKYDTMDPTIKTCKQAIEWRIQRASANSVKSFTDKPFRA